MSAVLALACLIAIYFEIKSIKACFVAEVYSAATEQMFNLVLLIALIFYLYATRYNVIIEIIL